LFIINAIFGRTIWTLFNQVRPSIAARIIQFTFEILSITDDIYPYCAIVLRYLTYNRSLTFCELTNAKLFIVVCLQYEARGNRVYYLAKHGRKNVNLAAFDRKMKNRGSWVTNQLFSSQTLIPNVNMSKRNGYPVVFALAEYGLGNVFR
jgi:hypothetical protein